MEQKIAWIGAAAAIALGLCFEAHGAETNAQTSPAVERCSRATRQHNADLGRTVLEQVLGQGRIAENEHIYHPDFVAHAASGDVGRAEDRAATEAWRAAAPDLHIEVLRVAADCDLVAVHFHGRGTNTAHANGLPGDGRTLDVQGITFFGIRDGKVAEEWTVFDRYGMMRQLGMLGE